MKAYAGLGEAEGQRVPWFEPCQPAGRFLIGQGTVHPYARHRGDRHRQEEFLEHLLRQDVLARRGLCLIDPHGDLYEAMVSFCAGIHRDEEKDPKKRRWGLKLAERVIFFNPSDPDFATGFNPLAKTDVNDITYQVGNLMLACVKVWGQDLFERDAPPCPLAGKRVLHPHREQRHLA